MVIGEFVAEHAWFSLAIAAVDIVIALMIVRRVSLLLNPFVYEAAGVKSAGRKGSIYVKGREVVRHHLSNVAGRGFLGRLYRRAERKMRRSGFQDRKAAVWYLLLKYLLPVPVFVVSFILNYPDIARSVAAALLIALSVEFVSGRRRARLGRQFNRNAYKIYKFLHNQVSSGIKVGDAVKTVYEVVEEGELRQSLVRMAARYELTRDMGSALEELTGRFDIPDTHTLCTAIRLGAETGDSSEMLSKQEGVMFKKYFNYIQAETERCRIKSVVSAVLFTAVIIILISVPMLMDVMDSVSRIFPA